MLTWLHCNKQQKYIESLWCEMCRRFQDRICGTKNFSATWITGSTNQKLSNVLDHVCSDQHKLSMSLLRVEQAKATNHLVTAYAPIAQERIRKKSGICYMLAKENLPFRKYPAIHELESRQGVDLGQSYVTKDFTRFLFCINVVC